MIRKLRARRKKRRDIAHDVALMTPEECAQLCRQFQRAGIGDKRLRLALAQKGMLSTNPGESHSMKLYFDAITAGRRIKYSVFPVRFLEPVPTDLENAVEEVYEELENEDGP